MTFFDYFKIMKRLLCYICINILIVIINMYLFEHLEEVAQGDHVFSYKQPQIILQYIK